MIHIRFNDDTPGIDEMGVNSMVSDKQRIRYYDPVNEDFPSIPWGKIAALELTEDP